MPSGFSMRRILFTVGLDGAVAAVIVVVTVVAAKAAVIVGGVDADAIFSSHACLACRPFLVLSSLHKITRIAMQPRSRGS